MKKIKYGICGLCFHSPGCGVKVLFDEEGKIDSLEPDPEAPLGTILCPIAKSAAQIIYSENRLRTPLKRVGPKGGYDFAPISWDEALGTIAEKLTEQKISHGPECVGIYTGTGSYERSFKDAHQLAGSEIYLASSVLFPFGSPNTFGVGAPCYTSLGVLAPKLTMGCLHIDMYSDIDNAELIFVWGTDPSTSTPPEAFQRLKRAAAEGAEIVVIDPRRTRAADLPGSRWIPIRPGSDGALALGLAHILIRDGRYDEDFAENWTVGFPEFKDYVKDFTPGFVSERTGIAQDLIESLAESLAEADGATYVMYTGLEYTKSGTQNIRAVMVLWALAGHLDVPGGRCFLPRETFIPLCRDHQLATPGLDKSIAKGRFPVYSHYCGGEPHASLLPRAIIDGDPYKLRALLVYGASLQTSWPGPDTWQKAMDSLDFLVVMDLQMTRDASYADIVLPASTAFEQEAYCYYGSSLRYREQMIDPVGESRSGYWFFSRLAEKLGYPDLFPADPKESLARVLKNSGFTLADVMNAEKFTIRSSPPPPQERKWEKGLLRKDGNPGFETPSGKFEILSSVLADHGCPGLPKFEESDETPFSNPDLFKTYPLILGTGPFKPDMKSCFRGVPDFIKRYPEPLVWMNTADATARNLETGDLVAITTPRGSVKMTAFATDAVMEGFAYAPVGGGGPIGPEAWQNANVNCLTDLTQYDPISGFPVYKTLLCQIKKKRRKGERLKVADPSLGCVG